MNIHRTPFSGRNGEYYSEDPFLSGTVASKEVYGAATKGLYATSSISPSMTRKTTAATVKASTVQQPG